MADPGWTHHRFETDVQLPRKRGFWAWLFNRPVKHYTCTLTIAFYSQKPPGHDVGIKIAGLNASLPRAVD